MHRGAFRTDKERMQKALEDQAFLDNKPTKPEHQNWSLRRRNRALEIGPEFRFNSTLQVQRILDTLQHDIGSWYEIDEVNGKNSGFRNDKALKQFIKTGEHNFVPGVNPDDYDSDTELKVALKRDKKIHQTTFVIPPRKVMPQLHRRLHFRGSQTMGLDHGVMKVTTRLYNEEFLDAQAQLNGEQNTHNSPKGAAYKMDANELEDQRLNKLRIMQDQKLDYAALTAKVLKKAKFQRSPKAAEPENFLKSRSGAGAWGHFESQQTCQTDYGKFGFERGSRTAAQSQRSKDVSLIDQSTTLSTLVRTESRGVVTRHKDVVTRKNLTLPTTDRSMNL